MGVNYFKVQDGLELHNDVLILDGSSNPAVAGQAAPVGSIYCQTDGTIWRKVYTGDTDWSRLEIITTGKETAVDASSGYTADSVDVDDHPACKWLLVVRSNGTPANRRAFEIFGLNDGSSVVDSTVYAVLKVNTKPAGLHVTVDLSAGYMRLRVTATETIDFYFTRVPVFFV